MDKHHEKKHRHINLHHYADSANQKFVNLAQSLMHLLSWSQTRRLNNPKEKKNKYKMPPTNQSQTQSEESCSSYPASGSMQHQQAAVTKNPQLFDTVVERAERILNRNGSSLYPSSEALACSFETDSTKPSLEHPLLQQKLRELFHNEAKHRLEAIRWLREQRFVQAASTLEGVLSIEEDGIVRKEIIRALVEIKTNKSGGVRCSRFSEESS